MHVRSHYRLWFRLGIVICGVACGASKDTRSGSLDRASKMQADRYIETAIHRSPEGVILLPSAKAERAFDYTQLNEIAHSLRQPFALCFVERAIQTVKRDPASDAQQYIHVPEGQIKFRIRIAPDGEVIQTEILENGFKDPTMESCLSKAVSQRKWPPNRANVVHFIDLVYWVSLGFQAEDAQPAFRHELRRQQAFAAERAKACFRGRVKPGSYAVEALLLADRNGRILAHRMESAPLPEEVLGCMGAAFQQIQLPAVNEGFIRPASPQVEFTVDSDLNVQFMDERWLKLITLEEQAIREAKRRELRGGNDDGVIQVPGAAKLSVPEPQSIPDTRERPKQPMSEQPSGLDPGKGGLKLNLGGR